MTVGLISIFSLLFSICDPLIFQENAKTSNKFQMEHFQITTLGLVYRQSSHFKFSVALQNKEASPLIMNQTTLQETVNLALAPKPTI